MQTSIVERQQNNVRPGRFSKRIGSTVYNVRVNFNTVKTESPEDKIIRMMKNDLTASALHGNMKMPQADAHPTEQARQEPWDRLPERGSI
jgi:hypothetical protein